MGMSASQARFLSLTARKTNVEYEGQQINQQRTTLSNESSNYYSQLTSMAVPTPPSTADYSKTTYTFTDGTEKNTITSLIAQKGGMYRINYIQEIPTNSMVSNGNVVVTRTAENEYRIGSKSFRLSNGQVTAQDLANDSYLSTLGLSESILEGLAANESQYYNMLVNKYGDNGWYVTYRQTAAGNYEPTFYNAREVQNSDYTENGLSLSGIRSYIYGETTETKEVLNARAILEQDTTGRYVNVTIYANDEDDVGVTYNLTTTTSSDDLAYNDAMNQYYYDKAQYDQKINEINAKIEIIQVQDKNLELKLKQLDTEENAISTEMDAVKKVISKNVESSFKTFNA